MSTQPVQLAATITITGNTAPYSVSVPVVVNRRTDANTPRPATIVYTLAEQSQAAGFALKDVVVQHTSPDIHVQSISHTQFVFSDDDTDAVESFNFGFHYTKGGQTYFEDPDIENEVPT